MHRDDSTPTGRSDAVLTRRWLRRLLAILAVPAAGAVVGAGASACTPGASAPRPTVEEPSMTVIPDRATAAVDRLDSPPTSAAEVSRLVVRDADGIFWSGSAGPGRAFPATRKRQSAEREALAGRSGRRSSA